MTRLTIKRDFRQEILDRIDRGLIKWAEDFINAESRGMRYVQTFYVEGCKFTITLEPTHMGETTAKLWKDKFKERN